MQQDQSVFLGQDAYDVLREKLGVSVQDVVDVVGQISAGFHAATALHPKGFSGTNAWAQGTRAIRELLIPRGWVPDDPSGQPRVASAVHKMAITVSSGDPHTGDPTHSPQTRNDKGAQTSTSVAFNSRQGRLFEVVTSADRAAALNTDGFALWIFLYYIDVDNREVRFELSKPSEMDANKVVDWSARMIFPPFDLRPAIDDSNDDEGPDIDINVIPKT